MRSLIIAIVFFAFILFSERFIGDIQIWSFLDLVDLSWILAMLISYGVMIFPAHSLLHWKRYSKFNFILAKVALICGLMLFFLQLTVLFENMDSPLNLKRNLSLTSSPLLWVVFLGFFFSLSSERQSTPIIRKSGKPGLGGCFMVAASAFYFLVCGVSLSSVVQMTACMLILGLSLIAGFSSYAGRRWIGIMSAGSFGAVFGAVCGTAYLLKVSKIELVGPGLSFSLLAVTYGACVVLIGSAFSCHYDLDVEVKSIDAAMSKSVGMLYIAAFIVLVDVAVVLFSLSS